MPEPTQITFSHKEVVVALLKEQNIHDGIWALYVKFGLKAANVGAADEDLLPVAIIPIVAIGLQRSDKTSNLAVDAALVNPVATGPKLIGAGKTPKVGKTIKKR